MSARIGFVSINKYLRHLTPYPETLRAREMIKGQAGYCPIVQDSYRNVLKVFSPLDLELLPSEKRASTNLSDEVANNILPMGILDDTFFEVMLGNFWVSDTENVVVEIMNPVFEPEAHNYDVLNAKLNIYDWPRIVNFPMKIRDPSRPVSIKMGQTLYYLRFETPGDQKIELHELKRESVTQDVAAMPILLRDGFKTKKWDHFIKLFGDKRRKSRIQYVTPDNIQRRITI